MADTKITALTAITTVDPAVDVLPIVDVSDTTMAASGTTKKITSNQILGAGGTATLASATISGDLTVDTNTLKVSSSTDTVSIGTTTTDAKFRILDASGNGVRIGFLPGTFNYNLYDATVHEFRDVNGSNSFGGINVNGIGLGRIPAASGIGVAFPATQSASSDANTLDDYEEGTWTIGIAFGGASTGITYSQNTGKYTKVGRLVTVFGAVDLTNKGSATGNASITGLPFSIGGASSDYSAASLQLVNVTFADFPMGFGNPTTTTIPLQEVTNGGVRTNLTDADFANNSAIIFSLTYSV